MTVLVVDDAPDVTHQICRFFERKCKSNKIPVDIVVAGSADEALQKLDEDTKRYDLGIVDLQMVYKGELNDYAGLFFIYQAYGERFKSMAIISAWAKNTEVESKKKEFKLEGYTIPFIHKNDPDGYLNKLWSYVQLKITF